MLISRLRLASKRIGRRILAAVAVSALVGAAVLAVSLYNDRRLAEATSVMSEFRQARLDLYQGFLNIILSRLPGAPWNRPLGEAQLAHALAEIERTAGLLPGLEGARATLLTELRDFSRLLSADVSEHGGPSADKLRAEFQHVDSLTAMVGSEIRRRVQELQAHGHRRFTVALAVAVLLLLLIAAGTVRAGLREAASIASTGESEERFNRLFEMAPLPMGFIDSTGRVVALNSRFRQVLGYTLADIPTAEAWWQAAYPDPEYREYALRTWTEHLAVTAEGGSARPEEYRVTCKDGSERRMLISGIELRSGVLGTFTDVTDRHRAEQALLREARLAVEAREQAETIGVELEAALGAMSESVIITDADGRFIHFNEAFARFYRYRDKSECAAVFDAYPALIEVRFPGGDEAPVDRWPMRRALRGESGVDQELHIRMRATGEAWIGSFNFAPIRDRSGGIVGAVVTARDVTLRKRTEDELHDNRERLQLLIEHAPAALAMLDREMRYVAASRRWLEDYKLAGRDIIGVSHYDVFPDIPQRWRDAHRRALAGEVSRMDEDRFERTDGAVQWAQWEVRPWYGRDGQVGGVGIFAEDITERKRAEEGLRESQAQLAQAQKMEAVGQLTGGVAHDFNNLLAVVHGNLELLQDSVPDRPDLQGFVATALRAARRGADLTQRLLAFSRRQDLRPERIGLNALVHGTIQLLSRTLGENIEIETSLDPDVGGVIADPRQLENALLNLAVNARDAMPGGGRLVVSTSRIDIEEGDAVGLDDIAPGQYGVVAVTDTGPGMDPAIAARAFEPFFTTKDVGKGTGLGLSMVYGFARQSGGLASLYSEPGVGTTVRIYLPCSKAGGRTAVESGPAAPGPLAHGECVLLVEDDRDVRELVARQLAGLGYAVHAVENGPGALAHLDSGAVVDLMLTDIVMPGGLSGTDLADAARARRPGLRVVFMSGYAEGNRTLDRIKAGPSLFIAKPFTKAQLSDVLRRALVAAAPSE